MMLRGCISGGGVVLAGILWTCHGMAAEPEVRIQRDGAAVRLDLTGATPGADLVLEVQAELATGEEWEPILRMRGGSATQSWYDPICSTPQSRFYRLVEKLNAPPPPVPNFRMLDIEGNSHELYYQRDVRLIVLILAGDDLASIEPYKEALAGLAARFAPGDARFAIVYAPRQLDRQSTRNRASELGLTLPIHEDRTHAVTRTLGSGMAPEAVVVSTVDWSFVYRGQIESVIAAGNGEVVRTYLADALDAYLAGTEPAISMAAAVDREAGLPALNPASYSETIAPLLLTHCVRCHSPGNIAPWAMTNYTVVRNFSSLIKSAVLSGQMPPWHADPHIGAFSNDTRLDPADVDLLVDWIDRGSPRGEGPDPLETPVHPAVIDWPLGQPDAIISIAPQSVPATGTVDYRYLFASSPFTSNVWLRAVVVKPGSLDVVHHCLVFTGSIQDLLRLQLGLGGFFAGYVPGMEQVPYPAGTGKQLRTSDIVLFQMHYTSMGQPRTDRTQLGLYLAPQPPPRELETGAAATTDIRIPPNSRGYARQAVKVFPAESVIYEFTPHMHYRGYSARYTLIYPDGSREVLLSVPNYAFDWQALYRLAEPKRVPAGSTLLAEGTFDNSIYNRFNPNPSQTVTFGEQTWEEMFIGYVNFAEAE